MWDTQYVDQVTQECKPVTQQVCNQVKKVRIHLSTLYVNNLSITPYQQVPKRVSKSVPKQVCDDGGSYGTQQSQSGGFSSSSGGFSGGSSGSSQGGYSGGQSFSEPRGKAPKLRVGSNPDAVNFGK